MPDLILWCDCSRPLGLGEVLSRHPTSEGEVRYLRCECGKIHLVVAGHPRASVPG